MEIRKFCCLEDFRGISNVGNFKNKTKILNSLDERLLSYLSRVIIIPLWILVDKSELLKIVYDKISYNDDLYSIQKYEIFSYPENVAPKCIAPFYSCLPTLGELYFKYADDIILRVGEIGFGLESDIILIKSGYRSHDCLDDNNAAYYKKDK